MIGWLARLVEFSGRHARLMLLGMALLTGLAGFDAVRHLGVNTDTDQLLSPKLPWRQQAAAFQAAFPESGSQTTVVIDGDSADSVEDGTAALAAALAKRTDLFKSVRRPDGGPFFDRYGLLFLPTEALGPLSDQLAAAQPLLGPLNADPSLRGLFGVLGQALDGIEAGQPGAEQVQGPLMLFAGAITALDDGKPAPVHWSELMTGHPPRPEELRHFILVQPILDYEDLQPGGKASDAIRATAAGLHLAEQGLRVRLTGDVPLEDDEFTSVTDGMGTATLGSLLLVSVILLVGLRAPRMILAIIVTLVIGLVLTAGFATVAVGTLNMLSVTFAVLFIGIGVDFGIQFAMRYRAELFAVTGGALPADRQAAQDAALARTARAIVQPLGIAALATAVGFYSFLPTDYRGVSELGLIAGTSMIIALIANLTVLPALISLIPGRGRAEEAGFAWAAPIDRWLARRALPVVVLAAGFGVAALACIPWVRFDADPLDLKDPSKESVRLAKELTRDPLASPYSIDVLVKDQAAAAALSAKLEALPETRMVLSLASFVPDDQAAKLDILDQMRLFLGPVLDPANRLPAPSPAEELAAVRAFDGHLHAVLSGKLAAQLGAGGPAMAEALDRFLALPGGGDVVALRQSLLGGLSGRLEQLRRSLEAGPLTLDTMPAEMKAAWVTADGRPRLEVFPKGNLNDAAQNLAFVNAVRGLAPDATGAPILILESGRTVSHAFLTASGLALVAITFVLALILRRVPDVVLVLIPLVLAGLFTMGAAVLLGLPFNYANVIAVPLLMGIGVAFDIYFVMAWRGSSGPVALLRSATARAVVFSACTTASAFGSLALSHHLGTASMGKLLIIALFFVLLTTLFVQPALMTLWGRRA